MKRTVVLSLMLLGFVAACSTGRQTVSRVTFPQAEYSQLKTSGNGVIHGSVFLESKDGTKLTSAGSKVILNPVTTYSSQWYDTGRKKQPLGEPDQQLLKYVREVITDKNGQFEFTQIPAGEYYLVTPLVWEDSALVEIHNPTTMRGRFVVRKVHIQDDDNLVVSLNLRISDYVDKSRLSNLNMPKWADRSY